VVPRLKSLGLKVALAGWLLGAFQGSLLPPRVVAELELNSVIPPPDTNEEEN